jgi:vacuolar-type H+-ATPase subunit C/Vma6
MPLFIEQGKIQCGLLSQAGSQETMNAAVGILESTLYEVPLKAGLNAYGNSALLSEFEKHLKRFQLEYYAKMMIKDPLGIGVPLGFLALKTNEVRNIRWMAQGIHLGLSSEAIRSELEYLL